MLPSTKSRIAGAIFDFMGYLTTRYTPIVSSRYHEPHDLLDAYCAWADERGLKPDDDYDADVNDWNLGEALIDAYLGEFYGAGRMPMNDPSQVGTAGSSKDKGRSSGTNYKKRRKWLEAKGPSGIEVTWIGIEGSDYKFSITWPNGTHEQWLVNPYLGRQYKVRLGKGAVGVIADSIKKNGRRISEGLNTNLGPGSERYPPIGAQSYERKKRRKYKGGKPELEYFGLAGLPGGARDDHDSPDSYSGIPQVKGR